MQIRGAAVDGGGRWVVEIGGEKGAVGRHRLRVGRMLAMEWSRSYEVGVGRGRRATTCNSASYPISSHSDSASSFTPSSVFSDTDPETACGDALLICSRQSEVEGFCWS